MAYTLQDKRDFFEKDIKYNIGMGVGNAFNKAVDFYISDKNINRGASEKDALLIIEGLRDMFYSSNQSKIEEEINSVLKANPINSWYAEQKAKDEEMKQAQDNVIDVGTDI
jgi:hypothetical protein